MQCIDGTTVHSATDLVAFLACEHLTALERAALHGLVQRPHCIDPVLDVLHKRGREHERRYLAGLEDAGLAVTTITPDGSIEAAGEHLRAAARATEDAMADGVDVIYEATLFRRRLAQQAQRPGRRAHSARPSLPRYGRSSRGHLESEAVPSRG